MITCTFLVHNTLQYRCTIYIHSYSAENLAAYIITPKWYTVSEKGDHLVGLVVKASPSRAEDPGFESRLHQDFFGVESYQSYQWHSSGYPARRLVLQGQCWDWLARCQYTMTGVDGKVVCNFYLSVAASKIVCADPCLRYTCMLLGR